jgi:hypothetical protein
MPPNASRGPTVAGGWVRLGGRKLAQTSCRDEVAAALHTLSVRDDRSVFTVREVYAQMVVAGTAYAESTVFKTMQRMKATPKRPPVIQLQRAEGEGFRIVDANVGR